MYPPVMPSPYRQNSYPAAPSPAYYPPVPPQQYVASPNYPQPYPPQAYPAQPYRSSSSGNHFSPPDRRHSGPSSSNTPSAAPPRRGHYSNLSWTPATGSRGGIQVPPRTRGTPKDSKEDTAEEDDNPFRPAKDLRAEDETAKEENGGSIMPPPAQPLSPKQETQADNKIKFALKSKLSVTPSSAPTDLLQTVKGKTVSSVASGLKNPKSRAASLEDRHEESISHARTTNKSDQPQSRNAREHEKQPEPRRVEKKLVKRIRPRPTLPPELAASDSVYFRKPGNESVVGSGTYGKVFRAIHVYTGEKVALKKIRMEGERDGVSST